MAKKRPSAPQARWRIVLKFDPEHQNWVFTCCKPGHTEGVYYGSAGSCYSAERQAKKTIAREQNKAVKDLEFTVEVKS